ncbi:MAG: deoxynucleoside kinase [Bacteroidia bacterium]|nr:deoxynucleoside kinase [Bacteroidia bacterium]NNC86364.1 deoxynucleoside kinase [Bacteroidia bacterium]NNM15602.1 deoxynucleoside kinase [Bacteroidia bacterium]
MDQYKYIVVEGNIGSGKTSLAKMISQEHDRELILEEFADNTFLPQFYNQPERYAFPLELSFLAARYHQLKKKLTALPLKTFVSDYLFDKSLLFAKVNLKEEEFGLYRTFFELLERDIPKPDLIIYLDKDIAKLQANIEKRGRPFEKDISNTYLENIQIGYEKILSDSGLNVLKINSGELDFVKNESHFKKVINRILTY